MEPVEIHNLGMCGAASADVMEKEVPQALRLDAELYLLLVGTNDMLRGSGNAVPLEEYERNLRCLIPVLSSRGRLILLSIPPNVESLEYLRQPQEGWKNGSPEERIRAGNRILATLAGEFRLPFCDLFPLFSRCDLTAGESPLINPANSGDPDGTHPTAAGAALIADAVFQRICSEHLFPRRIVCLGDSITCGAKLAGQGTSEGETYPACLKRRLNARLRNAG